MVNKDTEHPDRTELIQAIQSGTNPHAAHLGQCEFCRTIHDLLKISLAGPAGSSEVANGTVYRAAALAAYDQARHPAAHLAGAVGHDSWAFESGPAVRDNVSGQERRLTLTAGVYRLELIAERQQDRWNCVARFYKDNKPTGNFILTTGRRKLHTEARRCYFWSAKTPPRRLVVSSGEVRIDFGTIQW